MADRPFEPDQGCGMQQEEEQVPSSPAQATARRIDFSTYSITQLRDFQETVDRRAHPDTYQDLAAELARRESLPLAGPQVANITFTAREGLTGWLQTKLRRSR